MMNQTHGAPASGPAATDSHETAARVGSDTPTTQDRVTGLLAQFDAMGVEAWIEEMAHPEPRTPAPAADRTLDALLGFEVQA